MAARKNTTNAVTVTLGDPGDPTKVTAITDTPTPSEWAALDTPFDMPNKQNFGSIKVNVLESIDQNIRVRAEASLAINTVQVNAKTDSNAKRPRINYAWAVQKVASVEQGQRFSKALAKYAKYRPSEGNIPYRVEPSPMGQVTCRTGDVSYYRIGDDGIPVTCKPTDDGVFLGIRYSVRPLERRGDANRLPGTA